MHPIQAYYNTPGGVVLVLKKFVRKFLQLPVQDPMGSLARPVTGYETHDDPGHDQQC